jgi:hypothetical protein
MKKFFERKRDKMPPVEVSKDTVSKDADNAMKRFEQALKELDNILAKPVKRRKL